MEEARQNRYNRFLSGCPNRIGSGDIHSLAVADWSPKVDISEDDPEYLLKAGLLEMKKDESKPSM
jgi:HSP20 family protein